MMQLSKNLKENKSHKPFNADLLFKQMIQKDDAKAFESLFHQYYASLCKYAFKFVQAEEIVEELVSDVFLRIWNNRKKIEIQTSFQSYIFRAVHNQTLDYLRSKYARTAKMLEEINYKHGDFVESPEQHLVFQELDNKVENAIENLAPQARLIFRMSRDQGMKYREIAESLNLSIKTIETQMGRALKSLRNALL